MGIAKKDKKEIRVLELCAGYGGISLGLRRIIQNLRTVAYVEIEAFAVANLVAKIEQGWLDEAPIWTDVKTFKAEKFHGLVDILVGGFPCQPFSVAGNKNADDDPRHLFPHILRIIEDCRPKMVFLENVQGIISAKLKGDKWNDPQGTPVLLHVLRELERKGYEVAWGVFSAEEIGLPHERKRVFIVSYDASEQNKYEWKAIKYRWDKMGRDTDAVFKNNRQKETNGFARCNNMFIPAGKGEKQHKWEPPRTIKKK